MPPPILSCKRFVISPLSSDPSIVDIAAEVARFNIHEIMVEIYPMHSDPRSTAHIRTQSALITLEIFLSLLSLTTFPLFSS
jgi:hypothetical protein